MRVSTIFNSRKIKKIALWTIPVWILIWKLASMALDKEILMASPDAVLRSFVSLVQTAVFWQTICFSFQRIALGTCVALIAGVILAVLSAKITVAGDLLSLPIAILKATPVASFIILVLIWMPSRNLSILIAFIMGLPIIYTNVYEGIINEDKKLQEMSFIFRIPLYRQILYIDIPQVLPYFRAACSTAIGMCWKAGIAAEIIGIPDGSIGEKLYMAKIYLKTPEVYAWTITIIVISVICERLFALLLCYIEKRLEGRQ